MHGYQTLLLCPAKQVLCLPYLQPSLVCQPAETWEAVAPIDVCATSQRQHDCLGTRWDPSALSNRFNPPEKERALVAHGRSPCFRNSSEHKAAGHASKAAIAFQCPEKLLVKFNRTTDAQWLLPLGVARFFVPPLWLALLHMST
jgi:hypothetical protein